MLDHITLAVSDYHKSKQFYLAALSPLKYELIMEWDVFGGLGVAGKPDFWIACRSSDLIPKNFHVAFRAGSKDEVDAFYKAALGAGGKDNGAPGARPEYHENYYGAFVLDPDGHNIEAVFHGEFLS
ncbi:MAG: VOC family protein [Candidatus Gracilibacteria bacterium]